MGRARQMHYPKSTVRDKLLRLAIVAALALAPPMVLAQTDAVLLASPLHCLESPAGEQRLRDNLEIAKAYLRAAKDNFGPARHAAMAKTADAIAEFDRLHGEPPLTATPGTEVAHFLGSHRHPRMVRAQTALLEVAKDLKSAQCVNAVPLDSLRAAVDQAISGINDSFTYNPPGSGG